MEVSHDKVSIVNVDIERYGSQHYSTQTADQKRGNKTYGEDKGTVETEFATPDSRTPAKYFNPCRYGNNHRGCHKEHPQPARSSA